MILSLMMLATVAATITLTQGASNTISLTQSASDTITLDTPTGKIFGTLLLPASKTPMPLVVIVAGSGPTDRNGNSPLLPGANNSLKLLAEGLASHGVASVRYDKRGVAESVKAIVGEADLRFDMYADDVAAWVQKLRGDKRFSTITIVGHSEGSLLGMMAAEKSSADGYVSIAGAGRSADKVLREQLGRQLPSPLLDVANQILDTLLAGHTVPNPPPQLASLFRSSVQPYMISWLRVDPQAEIARLKIPVLILQGTLDAQVSSSDAELLARAHPGAKLVLVEGMNHVFKNVGSDQTSQQNSYSDPSIPVAPELVNSISSFVSSLHRK